MSKEPINIQQNTTSESAEWICGLCLAGVSYILAVPVIIVPILGALILTPPKLVTFSFSNRYLATICAGICIGFGVWILFGGLSQTIEAALLTAIRSEHLSLDWAIVMQKLWPYALMIFGGRFVLTNIREVVRTRRHNRSFASPKFEF